MSTEYELFKGTNFSDLMRDIYHNSKKKSRQIDLLIKNLEPMIKNTGDATVVVPMIKDYLEVSVKNDDALVKLAAVVQRIVSANNKEDDGNESGSTARRQHQHTYPGGIGDADRRDFQARHPDRGVCQQAAGRGHEQAPGD